MNILQLIQAILGVAEPIVSIFVHNPKSQQVEGIIVTTVNGALNGLSGSILASTPPAAPTTPAS